MSHFSIIRRSAARALGLLAFTLVACNDVAGLKRGTVSLSFAGGTTPARVAAASPSLATTASTLVITKAQAVFSHVELKQTESSTCVEDTQEHDDCEEMELAPMLVDLPVTGGVSQKLTVTVPTGTYRALEAKIEAVQSGEKGAAEFLAAHPDWAGRSLHIEGTYNGTPFVYDAAIEAELEMPFNPPVTVTQGSNNLTIDIGLSGWFKDASGNPLDPSNSANWAAIAASIRNSFHAFEDDDRDGQEDR